MVAKWGVFLCSCRQTLSIDPQRLDLPTPHVQLATHPDADAPAFARFVRAERLDRLLVGCCAPSDVFADSLPKTSKYYRVNLKDLCFQNHLDTDAAHAKASRLLRAAMQTAEVEAEPAYHPLRAGGRICIVTETLQGQSLAWQLRDSARPFLVIGAEAPALETAAVGRTHRGRVVEIRGRLGDFRVIVKEPESSATRELRADQVVIISTHDDFPTKARTGCHLLVNPGEAEIEQLAGRMRDLIGDFLKTVHVSYHADICAGGAANREACGVCIPACPYEAISRQDRNPFRMQVDHMSCEGCGACASACPTSALRFTQPSPDELYTRLAGLLAPLARGGDNERHVVLFHCGEQGKRVLEAAAQRSLAYPASVLPVEVPCLRYVSEANALAAFRLGAAGVGLLGCDACQHGERDLLMQKLDFCRLTLEAFDFGSDRLRLITTDNGTEADAIASLSRFAASLGEAPIPWEDQTLRHTSNRQVITEALATFMAQRQDGPGRRSFHAAYPFAFAEIQESGCTLCRACVNVCPVHAFKLDDASASLQYKHLDCVACGLCETVCPEQVIALHQEIYFERDGLDYQTVVQDDMVACARCGKPYMNRKALEAVEGRILSLDAFLDTFGGERQNLLRMCPDCRAVAAMQEVEKGWEP